LHHCIVCNSFPLEIQWPTYKRDPLWRAFKLAPQLRWSVERTHQAIENLETEYATLGPLRELTLRRLIHLGMVRNLWGRPRRIIRLYQN
jgi:hypothetical protein